MEHIETLNNLRKDMQRINLISKHYFLLLLSLSIIILLLLQLLYFFNALGILIPESEEIKQITDLGVSRLASSNFHIGIAERIGEADRVKALDRDRNALRKKQNVSRGSSVFEKMRWS